MPVVRVPAKYGDSVTITTADGSTTWSISDHTTNVADDKLEMFLANVDGSSLVSKPETAKKGNK